MKSLDPSPPGERCMGRLDKAASCESSLGEIANGGGRTITLFLLGMYARQLDRSQIHCNGVVLSMAFGGDQSLILIRSMLSTETIRIQNLPRAEGIFCFCCLIIPNRQLSTLSDFVNHALDFKERICKSKRCKRKSSP